MNRNKVARRRLLQASALLVGATLVLSACGGSSDNSDSIGSNLKGSPIKIGFALALTGTQASSVGTAGPAAMAWQDKVNAAGGLGGHPVKVILEDTQNNASAAQAAVKKLVDDKVVAIMLTDSVAEGPVGAYLEAQNIPVIGSGGYDQTVWNKLPNFFTQTGNSLAVIGSLVTSAKSANANEFVAAVCGETPTCAAGADALFGPGTAAAGIDYGGYIKLSATEPNYTAECLSFQKKKADYIALLVGVDTAVRVMTDCVQQGYTGEFASSSSSFDAVKYGKIPGLHMVGTLSSFPWWADAAPAKEYRDAMSKYQPKANIATSGATETWASLELFEKALGTNVTTVTPDSVFTAYRSLKGETLDGLLPEPITYTKGQGSPAVNCFWLYDFKAGDKDPTLVAPTGTSGNGASGDLATACLPPVA